MRLGVFAKTFDGTTPAAVLSAARHAGYEMVQYNMSCSGLVPLPPAISDEVAGAIREATAETGVGIASVSATYNMIHPDLGERERGRRGFASIAASAHRMGTRLLTVCTGTCDPFDQWRRHPGNSSVQAWQELCKEFRLLLSLADEHDILIGVEPEPANVIHSAQRACDLLDALNSSRIRIVLDAANLLEVGDAEERRSVVGEAIALLGGSIGLAHAKDRLSDGRIAPPGRGVLDYRHYLAALRKSGFDGCLVAHGMGADEAGSVAAFLKEELAAPGDKA